MPEQLPLTRFFETSPEISLAELRGQSAYDGQKLIVLNFKTEQADHLEALTIEAAIELATQIRFAAVELGFNLPD